MSVKKTEFENKVLKVNFPSASSALTDLYGMRTNAKVRYLG
jgi:hypothetical protein